MDDAEQQVGGGFVRLWRWSSAGAFCDRVPIDELAEAREQLRGLGYVTWVTRCGQEMRG